MLLSAIIKTSSPSRERPDLTLLHQLYISITHNLVCSVYVLLIYRVWIMGYHVSNEIASRVTVMGEGGCSW